MTSSLQPQLMSVQDLFAGSLFQVPDYQRAYAWEKKQCDDLWEDIREGMRTRTTHFLGTVVLMAKTDGTYQDSEGRGLRVFEVVDGQQRMTTLGLFLIAVYERVRQDHEGVARGLWRDFVEHEAGQCKLRLGGLNAKYFDGLVAAVRSQGEMPPDQRSTNVRLRDAVRRFRDLIEGWSPHETGTSMPLELATYIRENLQVLRFVTDNRPLAIKTFQTVNDRGKELSLLDKTKSFLMFYITLYLKDHDEVFEKVQTTFARIFDNYDAVRDLATNFKVSYLSQPQFRFNEDEFLRYAYHYSARSLVSNFNLESGYEYGITPERVFDDFIKKACRQLRDQPAVLGKFVLSLCDDLAAVSQALVSLLERIPDNPAYARLFRFQGPNASVYPLLVATQARGFLDDKIMEALSILDLRVYQIRGTDPKADLYRNTVSEMKTGERDTIYNNIVRYCRDFGTDQELDSILRGHVYRQSFTKYVLWQYALLQAAESDNREVNELDYELYADCQVDHVLPDASTTFEVTTFGFKTDEEYEAAKHGFGNLTVLESGLNRQAQNLPPAAKAVVYAASRLMENRVLGTRIGETGFKRQSQVDRENNIVQFFKQRWPIPL